MINGWGNRDDYWTNTASPGFHRNLKYRGYLEIRALGLSGSRGSKKNDLRMLRCGTSKPLRQESAADAGSVVWGCSDISGGGGAESPVQEVRDSETREMPWLANKPFYTKRFAYHVGRKCRAMTIKDVAKELKLDWHTVKTLGKEHMQEQLRRNPVAAPRAIGIDEITLRKGHIYRIVVSDLERGRPIWLGGEDRSEASLDLFYNSLGPKKSKKIELAVMDI